LSSQKRDQLWKKKNWCKGSAQSMQYLRRKQIVAWIKLEIDRGKTETQAKESLRILAREDKQLSDIANGG